MYLQGTRCIMSGKGLVKASITELERAVRSRESKMNFKKGSFQNKMYYKSLSFVIGIQVSLKIYLDSRTQKKTCREDNKRNSLEVRCAKQIEITFDKIVRNFVSYVTPVNKKLKN